MSMNRAFELTAYRLQAECSYAYNRFDDESHIILKSMYDPQTPLVLKLNFLSSRVKTLKPSSIILPKYLNIHFSDKDLLTFVQLT